MKKLTLAVMLLILTTGTSQALADHHVVVKPDDKILLSSDTIYILNNSEQYALYHSCELDVKSDSEIILKGNSRRISKSSLIEIDVDGKTKRCRINDIQHV